MLMTIDDPKTDQIGLVIKELQSIPTFTKAKKSRFRAITRAT